VGAASSYSLLRHLLGGLRTPALVRFLVRMLLSAGPAALAAWGTAWALHAGFGDGLDSKLGSVLFLAAVGLVDGVVYLLLARVLRVREVTEVVETVTRRLLPGRV
jgi:putative peptidoglycan lipid II flippase